MAKVEARVLVSIVASVEVDAVATKVIKVDITELVLELSYPTESVQVETGGKEVAKLIPVEESYVEELLLIDPTVTLGIFDRIVAGIPLVGVSVLDTLESWALLEVDITMANMPPDKPIKTTIHIAAKQIFRLRINCFQFFFFGIFFRSSLVGTSLYPALLSVLFGTLTNVGFITAKSRLGGSAMIVSLVDTINFKYTTTSEKVGLVLGF